MARKLDKIFKVLEVTATVISLVLHGKSTVAEIKDCKNKLGEK